MCAFFVRTLALDSPMPKYTQRMHTFGHNLIYFFFLLSLFFDMDRWSDTNK